MLPTELRRGLMVVWRERLPATCYWARHNHSGKALLWGLAGETPRPHESSNTSHHRVRLFRCPCLLEVIGGCDLSRPALVQIMVREDTEAWENVTSIYETAMLAKDEAECVRKTWAFAFLVCCRSTVEGDWYQANVCQSCRNRDFAFEVQFRMQYLPQLQGYDLFLCQIFTGLVHVWSFSFLWVHL